MDFVQDIDLVFVARRREADLFYDNAADLVHPGIGSRVYLYDVQGLGLRYLHAGGAGPAGDAVLGLVAVEAPGQDPGYGGLAAAARAVEHVGMGDAAQFHRVLEGDLYGFLPHDLSEVPVAVLGGKIFVHSFFGLRADGALTPRNLEDGKPLRGFPPA